MVAILDVYPLADDNDLLRVIPSRCWYVNEGIPVNLLIVLSYPCHFATFVGVAIDSRIGKPLIASVLQNYLRIIDQLTCGVRSQFIQLIGFPLCHRQRRPVSGTGLFPVGIDP
jgi:hypothetical protein